jgi:hypothetical protein
MGVWFWFGSPPRRLQCADVIDALMSSTALLERKPAVDDSVCANEFLQLLPAAIVRLVTAEQASSSPSDEASRFPESIAAVLHPSITVAMSYLESDVRVRGSYLPCCCRWLLSSEM